MNVTTQTGACPVTGKGSILEQGSLIDPEISAHPKAYYDAMRAEDPIHYDEKLHMYLVSRFEDIQTIQRDPITFSVEHGYKAQYSAGYFDEFKDILEREGGGYFPDAIMSDPPYHTRIRKLMQSAFTAHRVKALEPRIRDVVVNLLDSVAGRGECDAMKDVAIPLTIRVIVEQLGLDHGMEEKISRRSMAVT